MQDNTRTNYKEPELSKDHFSLIPNQLIIDLKEKKLKPIDIAVYAVYANRVGQKENCWVSNRHVAQLVGKCARSVQRCAKRLESAGHLNRRGKSEWGTKYTYLISRPDINAARQSANQANNSTLANAPLIKSCVRRKSLLEWLDEKENPAVEQAKGPAPKQEETFVEQENPFTGEIERVKVVSVENETESDPSDGVPF